jgi:MFS family permease
LIWILVAMAPIAIGGGVLQPTINSLITKRIEPGEIGGTLGISAALLSGANALAPLIGGVLFQIGGPTLTFLVWGLTMGVLWLVARSRLTPGREEQAPAGLARGGALDLTPTPSPGRRGEDNGAQWTDRVCGAPSFVSDRTNVV